MANRKLRKTARDLLTAAILLVLVVSLCSCADAVRALRVVFDDDYDTSDDDDDGRSGRHRTVPTDVTYETLQPTGSYSTESLDPIDYDIDYIRSVCIYTVWYDATEDNPMTGTYVEKDNAFAIKGVFYFSTPLTTTFEAKLYQDGELILTKEIVLNNNITAEADFSAGLEGWGTFDAGSYTIELFFEGDSVAITDSLYVEE